MTSRPDIPSLSTRLALWLYRVRALRPLIRRSCGGAEGKLMRSAAWNAVLRKWFGVRIGTYSYGSILDAGRLPRGTVVGNYCSVGVELLIRRRDHPIDRPAMHALFYKAALGMVDKDTIPANEDNPLVIENDVWIGDRVMILSGCRRIGNGAVLAAGSVVTRDVAPYTIVGGVPAKPIRRRFDDETIARIEASRWWERDILDLRRAPPLPGMFGPLAEAASGSGVPAGHALKSDRDA